MANFHSLISIKASKFRSANGLSESQPIDLKSLLLRLNVLTLFRPLSDDFSGMCIKSENNRFMLINSNNAAGRQHFTIAHELFHLFEEDDFFPHKCNPGMSKNVSEKNADAFAAELLMPTTGLWEMIPEHELRTKKISIATILKTEHYYSVSRAALLFRLQNIGLINKEHRVKLSAHPIATARTYGYDASLYRKANEGLVIGDYGEKARTLFENGKISEGHYLELLSKISNNEPFEED